MSQIIVLPPPLPAKESVKLETSKKEAPIKPVTAPLEKPANE